MNRERYSDPTADIAIAHVMAEEKRKKGIGYTHSEHQKMKPKKIPPIISRKDGDEIPPHNTRDSLHESNRIKPEALF